MEAEIDKVSRSACHCEERLSSLEPDELVARVQGGDLRRDDLCGRSRPCFRERAWTIADAELPGPLVIGIDSE